MVLGIDIGSRTVKTVLLDKQKIEDFQVALGGSDPYKTAVSLLKKYPKCPIAATGYGCHSLEDNWADTIITEIKAHAIGARYFFPSCRTVIDVGGQDSKVIALDDSGQFVNFQMNDKCAAGTGKFLEVMAKGWIILLKTSQRLELRKITQYELTACARFLRNRRLFPWFPSGLERKPLFAGCMRPLQGVLLPWLIVWVWLKMLCFQAVSREIRQ